MDNILEEFFTRNFSNRSNMPNPFNGSSFAEFISEQIKSAIPKNLNDIQGAGMTGNNPMGIPFQHQEAGDRTFTTSHNNNKKDIKYTMFEMHEYLIVRIALPNADQSKNRKVFVNSYELLLKEEGRDIPLLFVSLPKPVFSKKTKLTLQNGVLEVQMVKKSPEDHSEFDVSESENQL